MSKTDSPTAGVLFVPFVDLDDDGKHYVKVRTGRGEWGILSRGYVSHANAVQALQDIRRRMYEAYEKCSRE